jgi:hypothetical protein
MSLKITKTCRRNGTIESVDLKIEGAGILNEEENCQIFSERFLLLSTASGYTNFTHTRGQVVVPELPDLLTAEEAQVLERHQDQADGTLGALDALMTRSFTTRQREVNLRDLLDNLEHDTYEKSYYKWIIAAVIILLILMISFVTSKFWRRPLLRFASRFGWQRPAKPTGLPRPTPRGVRPEPVPMEDEDCELEERSILPNTSGRTTEVATIASTQQQLPDPKEDFSTRTERQPSTTPPMIGVRFSQPGRYQQV